MKKTIYYFVLVSVIILSITVSCKKPQTEHEEELPTGENTMYYYVDGDLYIPKSDIYSNAIVYSICDINNDTFDLSGDNIIFHFHNGINQEGLILFKQSYYDTCQVKNNHAFFSINELGSDGMYHSICYYTHDNSGTLNITYLSENKRQFKGTFEMTVYHENTGVEKHITEGHFNINLDAL